MEDVRKCHTIDGRRVREKDCAEVDTKLAQKNRTARRVEYLDVDAPIYVDVVVGAGDAVSEGKSFVKDRSVVNRDTVALLFNDRARHKRLVI